MPVYQGRDSCMARREGWYIKRIGHPGVDTISEAAALAWAVLRDYRRGYTYEQGSCRKIRMTWKLAKKRLRFIIRLARIHGATDRELVVIKRIVNHAIKRRKLPAKYKQRVEKMIVKIR